MFIAYFVCDDCDNISAKIFMVIDKNFDYSLDEFLVDIETNITK